MNGASLGPMAIRWPIGVALFLCALAGPAVGSPLISGNVTAPAGKSLDGAVVVATSDKYKVYRVNVDGDGNYQNFDAEPGTYTLAVVARGLEAPPATGQVLTNSQIIQRNFTLAEAKPFCIVKSSNPILLTDGIDSAAFMDAPEIDLKGGQNVVLGDPNVWGGPTTVSGRFRLKYSAQAIHLAADVTYKSPRVDNGLNGSLYDGNAVELDFQNDPYAADRAAYDPTHDWHLIVGLGDTPDWWLAKQIASHPLVNGQEEPLASHFMIQDKPTKDGETFRLDIPWAILLQGDASGMPITAPKDNDLGAMDLVLDAADPTVDRASATRRFQLTWSGFADTYTNPSSFRPVQFCPQAP
jgi:carboxypeptidase family protein